MARTKASEKLKWTGFVALSLCIAAVIMLGCGRKSSTTIPTSSEVVVTEVIQHDVPIYSEWIGTAVGYVNAEIRPMVEGYLLRQCYREGAVVKKGDTLFEIDPRQFQAALGDANGNLARSVAALDKANTDVARYTPLAAEKAISRQELDDALTAQRTAKANLDSSKASVDQAQLSLDWTKVASPIDGIAGIAQAQVGDLVNRSAAMTTVSTVDPIKVIFNISEQEYMRYAAVINSTDTRTKEPSFELVFEDGSYYPHKGMPVLSDRQVDIKTGTITLGVAFQNPGNLLRPGQYAKVRTVTKLKKGALLVPQRAVSELQGAYQLAVVGPDDVVTIRVVTPAERVGPLWIIDSGIRPGERVVVEGLQNVKTGMKVIPKSVPPEEMPATPAGGR